MNTLYFHNKMSHSVAKAEQWGCLLSKIVFQKMWSFIKDCLPLKIVSIERLSFIGGHLSSNIVFDWRLNYIKYLYFHNKLSQPFPKAEQWGYLRIAFLSEQKLSPPTYKHPWLYLFQCWLQGVFKEHLNNHSFEIYLHLVCKLYSLQEEGQGMQKCF